MIPFDLKHKLSATRHTLRTSLSVKTGLVNSAIFKVFLNISNTATMQNVYQKLDLENHFQNKMLKKKFRINFTEKPQ